jgi:DNA-binding transcriptional ArsR family regulator
MAMKSSDALAALGALAQESRLAVFRMLVATGPEGLPAGEIASRSGIPAPTLSFHLAQLRAAGLVRHRRESRSLIYAAEYETMNALVAYLLENCCGEGGARAVPACRPGRAARPRSAAVASGAVRASRARGARAR